MKFLSKAIRNISAIVLTAFSLPLFGQMYSSDGFSETGGVGSIPGTAFQLEGIEQINTQTLNVHLRIPLLTMKAHGSSFTLSLEANTSGTPYVDYTVCPGRSGDVRDGEDAGIPEGGYFEAVFYGCDGSQIPFAGGTQYLLSQDGSGTIDIGGDVYYSDGYRSDSAERYRDRNGNTFGIGEAGTSLDYLGTNVIEYDKPRYLKYYDQNGVQRTITFTYVAIDHKAADQTAVDRANYPFLHTIEYPNGLKYTFDYDIDNTDGSTTGALKKITLPFGGTISYVYPSHYNWDHCYDSLQRVISDGTASVQTYTYEKVNWNCQYPNNNPTYTSKVTDTVGNTETFEYTGHDLTHIWVRNAANQLLKEVENHYVARPALGTNNRLDWSKVSIDGNLQYTRSLQYTGSSLVDIVTQEKITAPDGTVLKQTDYTYKGGTGYGTYPSHLESLKASETTTGADGNISKTEYDYDEDVNSLVSYPGITPGMLPSNLIRGNLTSIKKYVDVANSISNTSHISHDVFGNVVDQEDAKHHHTYYTYTNDGTGGYYEWPTTITDNAGHATKITYNQYTNLVASVRDPNDIAASRNGTTYTYDSLNQLTDTYTPDGGHTNIEYGGGIDTSEYVSDDPNYPDPPIYPVMTRDYLTGQSSKTFYDGLGRPIATSIFTGIDDYWKVQTLQRYDSLGRVSYQSGGGTWSSTEYDALGRVVKETVPDAVRWTCYDGVATLSQPNCRSYVGGSAIGSVGRFASTWMDQSDWVSPTATSIPQNWQRASDGLGRLVNVVEPALPGGNVPVTRYAYDSLGNLTAALQMGGKSDGSEASSVERFFYYDGLSQLTKAYNPESGWTCYGTTPSNAAPNISNCTPAYDENGNLTAKTDARGVTTTYTYNDPLDRLTHKDYTVPANTAVNAAPVDYTYDDASVWGTSLTNTIGRLTTATTHEPNGGGKDYAVVYNYDSMGRPTSVFGVLPSDNNVRFTYTLSYDLGGRPLTITYPDGKVVSQDYDLQGRPWVVWLGIQPIAVDEYSINSGLLTSSWIGSTTKSLNYNSRGQLASSELTLNNLNTASYYREYSYTPINSACSGVAANNGNIWSITDSSIMSGLGTSQTFSKTYNYDCLNRITSGVGVKGISPSATTLFDETYNTDSYGNMIPHNNIGGNPSYSVEATTNRLQIASATGYDAAGNLTQNATQGFGYDPENRLALVNGGSTATYLYDDSGNRIRKDANGEWTEYVYVNGQVLAEKSANGWTDYIYDNGKRVAKLPSKENVVTVQGTGAAGEYAYFAVTGNAGLSGYTVQSGDHLVFRQRTHGDARGGMTFATSDTNDPHWYDVYYELDNEGQASHADGTAKEVWHQRVVSLDTIVGRPLTQLYFNLTWDGTGSGSIEYADVAVISGDGTVATVFNNAGSLPMTWWNSAGATSLSAGVQLIAADNKAIHYFVSDHLGSTAMEISSGGWPVSAQDYTPYGKSVGTPVDDHYKFTGKERDEETADASGNGLDYFGARYYSAGLGRFMSPDWSTEPIAIPFANIELPQTINLYAYVVINPLIYFDLSGHDPCAPEATGDKPSQPPAPCISGSEDSTSGQTVHTDQSITVTAPALPAINYNATSSLAFMLPSQPISQPTYAGRSNIPGAEARYTLHVTKKITLNRPKKQRKFTTAISGSVNIPVFGLPVLGGIGAAFPFTYVPEMRMVCGGIGVGASAGKTVSAGPVMLDMDNADSILGGWSVSGGYNLTPGIGGQFSVNASGATSGASFSNSPGGSISGTYSWCRRF